MRKATLAFLLGVLALYRFPDLPDARLGAAALALLVASIRFHSLRVPAWFALGFAWALLRASWILAAGLPPVLEGEPLVIEGTVAGLPRAYERAANFDMDVAAVTGMGREWPSPGRVRLSWYGRERILVPGETWRFAVKLKRPHGFMNPGGFDYEGWLFQHRIRALGHVIDSPRNRRLEAARGALVDRLRQRLALKLAGVARQSSQGNVLTALVIGTQDAIGAEQWQVFNRTGTSHLVSISGLHIGLIALLGFWVGRWLWSLPGFTVLYVAAPRVGAVCGTLATLVYSGLAGFSVPTQRSFIMIAVLMYGLVVNRLFKTIDLWFIALLLVLILDPFSVLAPGFWLSFGAVALILYGMGGRVAPSGLWWRIARLHVVVAIGLTPVLLMIFGQNPIVGPVANVLAVPWVSVVAAPLALTGTALCFVWERAGIALLDLALKNLEGLWVYLQYLSELDYATWVRAVPVPWIGGAAFIGVLIVLAPRGIPARWLGLVWLLPLLVTPPPRPKEGELWFTLLDVGQGLSAVVQTRDRTLVYDTGPRFNERFDAGRAVLVPYLRQHGIGHVDTLVISHGDSDHTGGLGSLLAEVSVGRILANGPIGGRRVSVCRDGQRWRWGDANFSVLHPALDAKGSDNNRSCILKVSLGDRSVLLPGDIEAEAEHELLKQHRRSLKADILVAPHHGSKTSSTASFIDAVAPDYVLFAAGYRNRYRFPAAAVLRAYRAGGAIPLLSAEEGAIRFGFGPGARYAPEFYRKETRQFWRTDAP